MILQTFNLSALVVELTQDLKDLAMRDEVIPPKYNGVHYLCSRCNRVMGQHTNFCSYCGQRLKEME